MLDGTIPNIEICTIIYTNNQLHEMTNDVVEMVSGRYIELYEKLTGKKFTIINSDNIIERINKNLKEFIIQFFLVFHLNYSPYLSNDDFHLNFLTK